MLGSVAQAQQPHFKRPVAMFPSPGLGEGFAVIFSLVSRTVSVIYSDLLLAGKSRHTQQVSKRTQRCSDKPGFTKIASRPDMACGAPFVELLSRRNH